MSEKDVQRPKRMTGPVFVVESEEGYIVAVTKRSKKKYAGIPRTQKIDCLLIQRLWQRIEAYWVERDMAATKSLLS